MQFIDGGVLEEGRDLHYIPGIVSCSQGKQTVHASSSTPSFLVLGRGSRRIPGIFIFQHNVHNLTPFQKWNGLHICEWEDQEL